MWALPKAGDHAYWALRYAYRRSGGYKDAQENERFWGAVADELEEAFASGRLRQKEGVYPSSTTQPLQGGTLPL